MFGNFWKCFCLKGTTRNLLQHCKGQKTKILGVSQTKIIMINSGLWPFMYANIFYDMTSAISSWTQLGLTKIDNHKGSVIKGKTITERGKFNIKSQFLSTRCEGNVTFLSLNKYKTICESVKKPKIVANNPTMCYLSRQPFFFSCHDLFWPSNLSIMSFCLWNKKKKHNRYIFLVKQNIQFKAKRKQTNYFQPFKVILLHQFLMTPSSDNLSIT